MEHLAVYEDLWFCLSGGNALGAYHAGVCEVMHRSRMHPTRIAGASIGAVTGAILAGNDADIGVERLREFWSLAKQNGPFGWPGSESSSFRYTLLGGTISFGRPGLFRSQAIVAI
jgi:NTE family protein